MRVDDSRLRVIRHRGSSGPGAARNTGVAACSTPFVGFVDSDVVLPETSAARLLAHLTDPGLGAAAPRVRRLGARGPIGGYEARHSPLDMGPDGGPVGPGRAISYVPSTVLFVRRVAMGAGYEESLPVGEDVDLVCRLHSAGWRIRYAAEVDVLHEHPVRLSQFMARQRLYASSIGALARRHPDVLPPLLVLASRWQWPRVVLSLAFGAVVVEDVISTRGPRSALADARVRLVDELISAAGTWEGCVRARTLRPLLPRFSQLAGLAA